MKTNRQARRSPLEVDESRAFGARAEPEDLYIEMPHRLEALGFSPDEDTGQHQLILA